MKLLGASAGAATLGVGLAAASDGPRHVQVSNPTHLCGIAPGDHNLALIEDAGHKRGCGFYTGPTKTRGAYVGWLQQSPPSGKASGAITPADDATKPSHQLLQVWQPSDLKQYEPGDNHLAFVEDASHEKGRGFYAGGSDGTWYFVGWLTQTEPAETAPGSTSPKKNSSQPDQRIIQVTKPKHLSNYDPTDNHLAFIEKSSHEKGRGFYAGGSDGTWYFVGWLSQSPPSGKASDTVDPNGSECGSDTTSSDSTSSTLSTDSLSDGAWRWWTEDIDSYESWLDEEIKVASIGHGKQTWDIIVDFDTRDFPEWIQNGTDRVFLPHIPMVPKEETDDVGRATALRNLAEGEYNDRFRSMAETFEADRFTPDSLVIRIGNEFNIGGVPYSPVGTDVTAQTWIEGYRQIVTTCRDVLGSDLQTVWAPLIQTTQMSGQEVIDHYPGAEYAMVGADIYDSAPAYEKQSIAPDGIDYDTAGTTDREKVQQYVWEKNHLEGNKWGSDGVGLNDIANLSNDVGSPIVIPEWGLDFDDYEWGGDVNPTFVQNMYDWMTKHDVAFHSYFEHDTPTAAHELSGGEFDFVTAADTYQQTFGGKSTGTVSDDSTGGETNYIFVTDSELQTQEKRVQDGKEPWKSAYDDLIADAENALTTSLKSVTDDDGDHSYKKTADRHDYLVSIEMSTWARDCATAYWFTGKDKYAERVVEILHHWCLADDTYMKPTADVVNNNNTIQQHITIPALMYAASFVRGHPAWDNYDGTRPWDGGDSGDAESAFERWVSDRYETFPETEPYKDSDICEYNNKWAWRIADRAVSGAYLRNDKKVDKAKCMWKGRCRKCDDGTKRPWNDFVNNYKDDRAYDGTANPKKNGLFKHELHRSNGFAYSAYNLKAMTMSLLVFERYDDTNLWDYNAPSDNKSGSSLRKAYNWLEEYTEDASAWEWDDGKVTKSDIEEATSTYEHACAHWSDLSDALEEPDKLGGRPYYDSRLLGHVTLTHGAD